jgi:DNA processing protein
MTGMISFDDKKYPKKLKEIKNPPRNLYYQGEIIYNNPCLAVIGSRNCSPENKKKVLEIIKGLPTETVIVSGLAKGIDTFAHLAAIKSGKQTIAVLPSGIERIYPKENENLAQKIIGSNGLLISEYPAKTRPTKYLFHPKKPNHRRTIISCFGDEAQMKSGTMHTVRFAQQQGKTIYAIPGL